MKIREKVLIILAILNGGILLISNLVAVKLWNLMGIAVDGGIICFPLMYVLGDLMIEFFDKDTCKTIILCSFLTNILAIVIFVLVGILPSFPGWENQDAYWAILGFAPRIVIGSLLGYVASSLINNLVFIKQRKKYGESKIASRVLNSSFVAHVADCLIFEVVAFIGVLPFVQFVRQAIFAYIAGVGLELILFPITKNIIVRIHAYTDGASA